MVYGHNLATCMECGKPYMSGDCVDVAGKCGTCEWSDLQSESMSKINALQIELNREKLKQEIRTILNDAISGVVDIYKREEFNSGGVTVTNWDRVEKHLLEAVDLYWPKKEKEDE